MQNEEKDIIQLIYIENGSKYSGGINRKEFIEQMDSMIKWFPGCNDNALKLRELLPNIYRITIDKNIVDTQTAPFILYQNFNESDIHCLTFIRTYRIIWDFFLHHCEEAKKNS